MGVEPMNERPNHSPGGGDPRGDAAPLRVAYVLKMFPRFSETFILNEILELERRGVKVIVFSMKAPTEAIRQPDVARLQAQTVVIPPFEGPANQEHLRAHLACFLESSMLASERKRALNIYIDILSIQYSFRDVKQRHDRLASPTS